MTNIKQKPEEYPRVERPVISIDTEHQKVNEQLEELRERALKAEKDKTIYANCCADVCHYLERFLDSIINGVNHSIHSRDSKLYISRYKSDNTEIEETMQLSEYLSSVAASIQSKNLPEKVIIINRDINGIFTLEKRIEQLEVLSESPVNLAGLDQTDKDLSRRISALEADLESWRPILNLMRPMAKR